MRKMAPNERIIEAAVAAIHSSRYCSVRAAAKADNIPRLTLHRRLNGTHLPRATVATAQQLLTPFQEDLVTQWILYCEQGGHPVSHAQLREFALLLARQSGTSESIGHNWTARFITRRPILKSKVGKKIDTARFEGATYETIDAWYTCLQAVRYP